MSHCSEISREKLNGAEAPDLAATHRNALPAFVCLDSSFKLQVRSWPHELGDLPNAVAEVAQIPREGRRSGQGSVFPTKGEGNHLVLFRIRIPFGKLDVENCRAAEGN